MAFMIPEVHLGVVLLFNSNDPAVPSVYRFMAWDAALIATGGEAQYFPPGDSFVVQYSRWIFGVLALLLAGGLVGLARMVQRVRRGKHASPRKALAWAGLALLVVVGLVLLIFLWLLPDNNVTLSVLRGFAPDLWVLLVLILALLAGWAAAGAAVAGLVISQSRQMKAAAEI